MVVDESWAALARKREAGAAYGTIRHVQGAKSRTSRARQFVGAIDIDGWWILLMLMLLGASSDKGVLFGERLPCGEWWFCCPHRLCQCRIPDQRWLVQICIWGGASLTYDKIVHIFKYLVSSEHRSISTVSETNRLCCSPCHSPPKSLRAVGSGSSNQSVPYSPQGSCSHFSVCQDSIFTRWLLGEDGQHDVQLLHWHIKRN